MKATSRVSAFMFNPHTNTHTNPCRASTPPVLRPGFLTIGLASVKRKKGSYLLPTLASLFSQSSSKERASMVVVVLLAEFDPVWRGVTLDEIRAAHPSELDKGQLLVIHVPPQFYPPLTGTDLLPQTTELHILGPLSNIEGAPDHRVT